MREEIRRDWLLKREMRSEESCENVALIDVVIICGWCMLSSVVIEIGVNICSKLVIRSEVGSIIKEYVCSAAFPFDSI